jgi:hypothetical protein
MMRTFAAVLLCAVLGAAAPAALAQNAAEAAVPQLASLRAEINEMIGPAPCANLVNCRVVALGSRLCGGAAEYVAYSNRGTDRVGLETKVAEYNIAYDDYLTKQPPGGACVVLPEPVAACINNRCAVPGAH